jgi:ribonuclease Y
VTKKWLNRKRIRDKESQVSGELTKSKKSKLSILESKIKAQILDLEYLEKKDKKKHIRVKLRQP